MYVADTVAKEQPEKAEVLLGTWPAGRTVLPYRVTQGNSQEFAGLLVCMPKAEVVARNEANTQPDPDIVPAP